MEPYQQIQDAVKRSLGEAQMYVGISGWTRVSNGPRENYRIRIYYKDNKLAVDSFVNDERKLLIIADGKKLWRYDPVANEYTFMAQPEAIQQTFGIAAAWVRTEVQRPIRLFAGSARWLIRPQFVATADQVRIFDRVDTNGDWRGTDLNFQFDQPNGKLQSFTIDQKLPTAYGGVQESRFTGTCIYSQPFNNVSFRFIPPAGAKPAADLPKRIG